MGDKIKIRADEKIDRVMTKLCEKRQQQQQQHTKNKTKVLAKTLEVLRFYQILSSQIWISLEPSKWARPVGSA
ncbi:hypothetical protein H5410_013434 [Solanum commersonii]|uniref:Uncharacterized protein n=1 Tax=Solanum commersonii TaxID=4109 RepID=A0A9J6AUM1_SOLCO|nr:hypothetical protein H5410_013434 [Solanum commersonii]